jgi:hypothetical protein
MTRGQVPRLGLDEWNSSGCARTTSPSSATTSTTPGPHQAPPSKTEQIEQRLFRRVDVVGQPSSIDGPVVTVGRVVEAREGDWPPPHCLRHIPSTCAHKLIDSRVEPFGQGIGVGRLLHHRLKPNLRLAPLLWSFQVDADPPTEVSSHCLSDRGRKGVPEKSPAPVDKFIDLVGRQRPGGHDKRLRALTSRGCRRTLRSFHGPSK